MPQEQPQDESYSADVLDIRQVVPVQDWLLDYYTGCDPRERSVLIQGMIHYWSAFETKILALGGNLTVRQAFLVAKELVVEESRLMYRDLDARRHFTAPDDDLTEARAVYAEIVTPEETLDAKIEKSASALSGFSDWVEAD